MSHGNKHQNIKWNSVCIRLNTAIICQMSVKSDLQYYIITLTVELDYKARLGQYIS